MVQPHWSNKYISYSYTFQSQGTRYAKLQKRHRNVQQLHNFKLMGFISASVCFLWLSLLAPSFHSAQFDFKDGVMQPAPPVPSSLQVTGLPVQDVCLHSMKAPTNPVLQTSYIPAASQWMYIKTVARHGSAKPGLSTWMFVNLVRAD